MPRRHGAPRPLATNLPTRTALLALAILTQLALPRIGQADFDGMESPTPAWRLLESDCAARVIAQARVDDEVHQGALAESIAIQTALGSKAYLGYAIPPSYAIAELQISLWVRSPSPGIQVFARVVFPRTLDDQGAPMRRLIPGDAYVDPGEWNRLAVHELHSQAESYASSLRAELHRAVDTRGAYVDLIVLNVYNRPGKRELVIDQLEITGQVPVLGDVAAPGDAYASANVGTIRPASATEAIEPLGELSTPGVRRQGRVLLVDERPFFARMIDRNGEPLEFLASLGAEVVRQRTPPSAFDRDEARRLGLRFVAPPPPLAGQSEWDESWNPILAWSLEEFPAGRRAALREELRRHPFGRRRPEMSLGDDPTRSAGESPSLVLHDGAWLGGSRDLLEFPVWLADRRTAEPGDVPFFVSIAEHWPAAADRQASAMAPDWQTGGPFDPQAVRLLAHLAIGQQARGIYLRSERSLQEATPYARQRASCVRLIFQELRLWEPWIAGGEAAAPRRAGGWDAYELSTPRSRILFCIRQAPGEQLVLAPETPRALSVFVDGSSAAMALRVRDAGLERIEQTDSAGGRTLSIPDAGRIETFLLTQDPTSLAHFRREWLAWRRLRSDRERDALAAALAVVEETERRLDQVGLSSPESLRRIEWAHANRKRMDELAGREQEREIRALAEQATRSLAAVRRDAWAKLLRGSDAEASTPFGCGYEGLAWRHRFSETFHAVPTGGDLLAAGDFEDLHAATAAGWTNRQSVPPGVTTSVRLAAQAAFRGAAGLEATAVAVDSTARNYSEAKPLVAISTPPLELSPGTPICVHGMLQFEGTDGRAGVRIVDDHSGDALALYIAPSGDWRPFTLYRVPASGVPFSISFELFRPGTLRVDEIVVRPVELP